MHFGTFTNGALKYHNSGICLISLYFFKVVFQFDSILSHKYIEIVKSL